MSMNAALSTIYIARQTAKGTVATAPQYILPLTDGDLITFERKEEIDEETGQVYASNAYSSEVSCGASFSCRAYSQIMGTLFAGIMGAVVDTGSASPYTHVMTVAETTPWYTIWARTDKGYARITDAKLDSVSFEFEGNKPPTLKATYAGITIGFGSTMAAPAGGISLAGTAYFTPAGGTFKFSAADASAVVTPITKFSVEDSRNTTPEYYCGSILPGDVSMGKFASKPSITLKPEDFSAFYAAATGTATGTAVAQSVITGSYEVTLVCGTKSLKLAAPRVPFAIDWPSADASGGAIEFEAKADDSLGTATVSPQTITLIDDVASYTAA